MIIEKIEVIPLEVQLKKRFAGSAYSMNNRATLITRIYTDEGVIGTCYNGDEPFTQVEIAKIMQEELFPRIVGKDPMNVEALWHEMLPVTFDILRDRNLVIMAMSAIDSALWDIVGKAAGLPVSKLWGAAKTRLPIIAIGGYYGQSLTQLKEEVDNLRELGLGGCKMKVGGVTPEEDAARFNAMSDAAGDDFVLMADANQGYTLEQAVDFTRRIDRSRLAWFEEPCRWTFDRTWLRDVRYMSGVPVAAGQSEHSRAGVRELLETGSIDFCNYDASWSGGPTEWLKIAGMASAYGVRMAHHEEAQISIHLLASVQDASYVEVFHPDRDPVWWNIMENPPTPTSGFVDVPTTPGWGFELDWGWVNKHRLDT